MQIFFDRSVEPRYVRAIAQRPWASIETADAQFPQTASDTTLAQYADDNGMGKSKSISSIQIVIQASARCRYHLACHILKSDHETIDPFLSRNTSLNAVCPAFCICFRIVT